MKRLFVVKDNKGNVDYDTTNGGYHDNKAEAKKHRDRMNHGLETKPYTVSPGPDHHNYKGH